MRATHVVSLLAVVGLACEDEGTQLIDDVFTPEEWAEVQMLSPLPPTPPPDPTNAFGDDPAAQALGQKLFFETDYAGPLVVGDDGSNGGLGEVGERGKTGCTSCHNPDAWFSDRRSNPNQTALGADWGIRNAMSLVNSSYHQPFQHWDGRFDAPYGPALGPAENPKSVNSTRLTIAHMMWDQYRAEYDAIFDPDLDPALDPAHAEAARFPASGKPKPVTDPPAPDGPWELMTPEDRTIVNRIFVNWGKAVASYVRLLRSADAPFDRYVAGDRDAISASAKRGAKLFVGKAACTECHEGPTFTDNEFHNVGVPQVGEHVPAMDDGRFAAIMPIIGYGFNSSSMFSDSTATGRLDGLAADEALRGAFLTPMLRNCADTGPWMHAGQNATLEDVVELYDKGGEETGFSGTKDELIEPLMLTAQEKADLVEFLKTLTGTPIPAELLVDTSN